MSEKLPEPYGWIHDGAPDGPLFRREPLGGIAGLCASSAPVYSHEQMRAAVAEADDLRRERDELAARLTTISEMSEARRSEMAAVISLNEHMVERLKVERDELARQNGGLAARLAEIERAEPVAWLYHDAKTAHEAHPWLHSTMVVLNADRRPGLRGETPLYTLPSPAAAPERAEPDHCEDAREMVCATSDPDGCPKGGAA